MKYTIGYGFAYFRWATLSGFEKDHELAAWSWGRERDEKWRNL